MKKIHIGGVYYGQHNIGDEAILHSMIESFIDKCEISVSTYGSEWIDETFDNVKKRDIVVKYTEPKLGLYVDPRKQIFSNIKKIKAEKDFYKSLDIYICGGATILSDCPWYSLRTVQLSGKVGTPVYLWGVGMAEIEDDRIIKYIASILNQPYVKKIYTRDELVKDRLAKIGVAKEKLFVSYDPAIMIDSEEFAIDNYLTDEQKSLYLNNRPNIVLTVSGEADVVKRTPIDVVKKAINIIQTKYDANIFLIPTGCGKHCKDTDFLKAIGSELKNDKIIVIEKEFSPNDLVAFLHKVDLIISSRLHMNIFGACASVPSIGLVRNKKIIDFANLLDLPYFELQSLDCEKLVSQVTDILQHKDKYRTVIKNKVDKMRMQYRESLRNIKKEIGKE